MQIKKHKPTGLWVREDGAVLMPPRKNIRRFKYVWSFGYPDKDGYLRIKFNYKLYRIHRLVFESFKGAIPQNFVIDHINRVRHDNRLENLRLATILDNSRNSYRYDRCGELYGAHSRENSAVYQHEYRKANPSLVKNWNKHRIETSRAHYVGNRDNILASRKAYRERLKALGKHERKCPDGKRRFLTDAEYIELYGSTGGV